MVEYSICPKCGKKGLYEPWQSPLDRCICKATPRCRYCNSYAARLRRTQEMIDRELQKTREYNIKQREREEKK